MEFDELSRSVIGCAIEVHRNLGPGLLESTYRQCLACELSHAGILFQMELPLPVRYKNILLDCGYRIDLLVRGELIVEIKSVEALLPIHQAQILTYMRLANVPIRLLVNFNVTRLQTGIKRFVL
ncbi:MAG: GxxExxY protein [Verrucomicrobia bacterium]|nr:MAG: GxxExxY protein [Verrucomicrobiota bacterium]